MPPGGTGWSDTDSRIEVFAGLLRSNLLGVALRGAALFDGDPEDRARRCVDYVWAALFPPRAATGQ